ncbi:hypothetical protein DVH24_008998 [Malus domestica]|uniref:Rhodanese domain-containing protein n=1 Tax=Malus domestica TaxID=3750 RepID=A0A498JRM4_MALDO|nr:hypothetical protein DVH24_008998 [Malus domestica]
MQQVGSTVFDGTAHVLESVLNAVKPGIDAALPIGKQAGEQALKIASPARLPKKQSMALGLTYRLYSVLQRLVYKVFCLLKLNTLTERSIWSQTVADAAGQTTEAVEEAKPLASSTIQTISSADPIVIAGTAGALFLAYLLLPPIWSALSFSLRVRGYQDIRPEKDKDKAGIPRLPSSAESKMIAIPLEELPNKLRGLVRNAKKVEAEIAALKISYLKRVNKGSSISDSGKIVARALTRLGFKNCWTVADGSSGSKGWLQSRLDTDSYNSSFAEVISPSRVVPAAVRRFGTTSTSAESGRKLLPGSD